MRSAIGIMLSVLTCAAAGVAGAAPAYQVRAGHPRLFFDKEGLKAIAKRCDAGGPCNAGYEAMKKTLAQRAMNPKSAYYPGGGNHRLDMALAYLVEKELGRDGSKYLEHLKAKAWKAPAEGVSASFGWDAVLYDWLYDELPPDERRARAEQLGRALRHYTGKPFITLDDGTYWYNQTWSPFMGVSWSRDGICPKTLVALAIVGDGTPAEADARQWLDSFAQRMPTDFTAKLDELGGVWPEGPGHAAVTYAPFLAWEAWRLATGQDLFPKVAPTGFHREVPYWYLYARMPHTGSLAHTDDAGPGNFMGSPHVSFQALHAARYRDGISQSRIGGTRESGGDWADIVWLDPSVPVADVKTLPLAYHFRGAGYSFMRSGWGSPDDTFALFSAGPYFTAYGTWGGNGTFQIARQGLLAGNAGYQRYSMEASAHQNVVLVYDPNEKFFEHGGKPRRNDGGAQIPTPWHVTTPMERGKTLAYETTDAYTYVGADVTKAYSHTGYSDAERAKFQSEKIKSFTRQFLYVRGEPEFFVVYDRVEASEAEFPKTWLLHVLNEPEITAGGKTLPVASQGPGFQAFQGADSAFVSVAARNDKGPWRTDKRGAVAVRTLLPENARITRRGGKGFDMWGDPHDPNAANWVDPEASRIQSEMDMCYWRLEVEPPNKAQYHRFLHVIIPYGDAAGKKAHELSPQASDFRLVRAGDREGARLELGGAVWEITFARTGPMGGSVRIQRPGAAPVAAELVREVRPNAMPPGLAVSR